MTELPKVGEKLNGPRSSYFNLFTSRTTKKRQVGKRAKVITWLMIQSERPTTKIRREPSHKRIDPGEDTKEGKLGISPKWEINPLRTY